ncbi:MAG TPA: TrkA family potassium uptake protein [Anaerolineae bacterium]|nr:TrkA family potassium uptake protein [Anaerolineae bacterium]
MDFGKQWSSFRRRRPIQEFAVIGLGRFGTSLALELEETGHTVLGIDYNQERVQMLAEQLTQVVSLDATLDDALRAVDIGSFDTVIVTIGSDFESNLMTTVALKSLGVPYVICKAMSKKQQDILLRVGADRVIQPEHDAGQRLAHELTAPTILERLSLGPDHSVVELKVPTAFLRQSLAQTDIRNIYGVTVLAVQRGAVVEVAPPAEYVLQKDDVLVVLGANTNITTFCQLQ